MVQPQGSQRRILASSRGGGVRVRRSLLHAVLWRIVASDAASASVCASDCYRGTWYQRMALRLVTRRALPPLRGGLR